MPDLNPCAADPRLLWAPQAWVQGQWRSDVVLTVDVNGQLLEVCTGMAAPPGATRLPGPVLPGMVNAHSHAFQRAFAGLAERRSGERDDFWSWRDRMYAVALRVTPEQLHAIATQLYTEMLRGGYTQVCEFHYLHHDADGSRYADPAEMSLALVQAAQDAGIGITLLPVLYQRAGFTQATLREDQRRFASTVELVRTLSSRVNALMSPLARAGLAVHSLRAAPAEAVQELALQARFLDGPVHIHIAEQTAEVDDCLAATGLRPIEWLARHVPLDHRWHLVHATHTTPGEIEAVRRSGAGVVICPSTEANLGDGLCDLPGWLASDTPLSIGSDSHMSRSWVDELRWLEYGQRLALRRRNVAAAPELGLASTAARLFDRSIAGGAAAAGFERWGLVEGARADLLVLDADAPGLLGVPDSHRLDALVFATNALAFTEVWVAGQRRLEQGLHIRQREARAGFAHAMRELWAEL
ncbi:MAG: formimidoylglutamate deiminase [Ideonella sp.]|nr:formimidoylglutamate deiminase [Ideonella sp.]